MIVLVIQHKSVSIPELECDAPIAADRNGPLSLHFAFKQMKIETGNVHIIDFLGSIKRCQLHSQPIRMSRLDARVFTRFIESFESLVAE